MAATSLSLLLKSKTWSRDSHGLYDYESSNIAEKCLHIDQTCSVSRSETTVGLTRQEDCESSLFTVEPGPDHFSVTACTNQQLWLVVRHMQTAERPGCELHEGDTIKLGRVELRVKELQGPDDAQAPGTVSESDGEETGVPVQQCRICLCSEADELNPLVSPCQCAGSMKHIHVECLQTWLESRKVTRQSENSVNHFWKSMDCELCKAAFPFSVRAFGKAFPLIQKEELIKPYLILEMVNRANGLLMISLTSDAGVKLGRGHDSDIRILDISVSRVHAAIHFINGKFYFEDRGSKFGSLMLVRDQLTLRPQQEHFLQVGRSFFEMQLCEPTD